MSAYNGKVTIWVQKEDREKWNKIQNKPEWLHKVIQLGFDEYQISLNPIQIIEGNPYERLTQSEYKKYSKAYDELISDQKEQP